MRIGYTQIYTGNGKGKTTAALGLILRATGAGLRVYAGQFIKKGRYGEITALRKFLPFVKLEQYGPAKFVRGTPSANEIGAASRGLRKLASAMASGRFDVVVADEIFPALSCGLIALTEVLALIETRPEGVELILTGRGAPRQVLAKADLVTEMKCRRHYFSKGVHCRKGIEF